MGLIVLLAIGGAIAGYIRRDDVCCSYILCTLFTYVILYI